MTYATAHPAAYPTVPVEVSGSNDEGDSTFYVFVDDRTGCLSLYVMHDSFHETSQDGTESLVARLTPKAGAVAPTDLHTPCMAALPEYRSAIAPHRYVVHATAPADEADEADWQRQRILLEGDGR
jgi:hypothetical protein